jgi:DNA mismatch endonuclease, patch repair protein
MVAARRRDTFAERAVRSAVHKLGLRYRVDASPLRGVRSRADLVFPGERVAVFVDGCFWHSCPSHGTVPKANAAWWQSKLDANRARDHRTNEALSAAGWAVLRVWEHEDPTEAAQRVHRLVMSRRHGSSGT